MATQLFEFFDFYIDP